MEIKFFVIFGLLTVQQVSCRSFFDLSSVEQYDLHESKDGEDGTSSPSAGHISDNISAEETSKDPSISSPVVGNISGDNKVEEISGEEILSKGHLQGISKPKSDSEGSEETDALGRLSRRTREVAGFPSVMPEGRTHNQNAPRRSFGEAMRIVAGRYKFVSENMQSARKAWQEKGFLGLADYLVEVSDTLREPPILNFTIATVDRQPGNSTLKVLLNQPVPSNGPPFMFSLNEILPEILDEVLETERVSLGYGKSVRVVKHIKDKDIFLEVVPRQKKEEEVEEATPEPLS